MERWSSIICLKVFYLVSLEFEILILDSSTSYLELLFRLFLFKPSIPTISFFALILASIFLAHFVIIFAAYSFFSFSFAIMSKSCRCLIALYVCFIFFIFPSILSIKLFFISLGLAVLLYVIILPCWSTNNFLSVSTIYISSFT